MCVSIKRDMSALLFARCSIFTRTSSSGNSSCPESPEEVGIYLHNSGTVLETKLDFLFLCAPGVLLLAYGDPGILLHLLICMARAPG